MIDRSTIYSTAHSLPAISRRLLAASVTVSLIVTTVCRAADPQSVVVTMIPPERARIVDWAFDPATRNMFACADNIAQVIMFEPRTGKPVKQFDTGARPTQMLVADRRLVVANSAGLSMIDLNRLSPAGTISDVGVPMAMAYAQEGGLVYLSTSVSQGTTGEQLIQLHLGSRFVRNRVPWWQLQTRRVHRMAVSPTGTALLAGVDGRGYAGPYYLYPIGNQELPAQRVKPTLGPPGELSAGPSDYVWFIGSALYSNDDLSHPLRRYQGELTIAHPTHDLAISVAILDDAPDAPGLMLWYQRYSNGEQIQREEIQLDLASGAHNRRDRLEHRRLAVDESGHFVFLALDAGACLIRIPQQIFDQVGPALRLDFPTVSKGVPNESWVLSPPVNDNWPEDSVRFRLLKGPQGMRLIDGSIEWQPTMADIGNHQVEFEVQYGQRTEAMSITVSIEIPHASTGIAARTLVLDSEGTFAAIFGQPSVDPRRDLIASANVPPSHVAVVRLQDHKVLRREAIAGDVRDAFLDAHQLYWMAKNVNILHRLELHSSRPIDSHPLHSSVVQMFALGDDRLALALADRDRLEFRVLNRTDLTPIADHPLAKVLFQPWRQRSQQPIVFHVDDDLLYLNGQLIDQATGKRRCFVTRLAMVPPLIQQTTASSGWNLNSQSVYAWRRVIGATGIAKLGGPPLFRWNARTWTASRSVPLVAMLESGTVGGSLRYDVVLRDVVLGGVVRSDRLPVEFDARDASRGYGQSIVEMAGKTVVALVRDELFVYQLPAAFGANVVQPLRLHYPTLDLVAVDDRLSFRLMASGGATPYLFESKLAHDGVRVAAESGDVTIDLPGIWEDFLNQVKSGSRNDVANVARLRVRPMQFDDFAGISLAEDQAIVSLPLGFEVRDHSGQSDQIEVTLAVVVPKVAIDAALAAAEEKRNAVRAERQQLRTTGTHEPSEGRRELDSRVDELDERVQRLEAALDSLLRGNREEEKAPSRRTVPE